MILNLLNLMFDSSPQIVVLLLKLQYNCISLGLAAGAAAAIGSGRRIIGSILFCLSLNHKQMGLFFAPAFFAHLLGWCFQHRSLSGKVISIYESLWWCTLSETVFTPPPQPSLCSSQLLALSKLGIAVIATFAVCWAPCVRSLDNVLMVRLSTGAVYPLSKP